MIQPDTVALDMTAIPSTVAVPVYADERAGLDRTGEFIIGGVPLPCGTARTGGRWQLQRDDGRSFSMQGTPAAYWPDGSIKWLHIAGTADLAAGQRNRFTLRPDAPAGHGDTAPDVAGDQEVTCDGLTYRAGPDAIAIRGGAIDVTVSNGTAGLLAVSRGGRERLAAPGLSARLALEGPDGGNRRRYDLSPAGAPEVVAASPERVVIRVPGRFADAAGRCVGELILFLEVCRGLPEVRIEPVFIYLGFPPDDLVTELVLTAHVAPGAGTAYALAGEDGACYADAVHRAPGHPRWPQARLLQTGSSFFLVQKRTGADGAWVKALEGRRNDGWCRWSGPAGNVTAALRYVWQEYPRSLTVDTDAGRLEFGLIPGGPAGGPLDLRRYSPEIYGMVVYETGKGPFPQATHGATGIAKASELMLRFGDPGDETDGSRRARCFNHPCRLLPGPAYFVSTGVAGHVPAADPPTDPVVEGQLARIADFIVRERAVRGWYGLLDFGDVMECYEPSRGLWAFDLGGYAWLNSEGLPDLGLFLSGLRAGRSDWVEGALEMSRHIRDVDMYHRGQLAGVGSRHHINHWGDLDKEWRISMPLVRRLHYYLTADPWTAEVIRHTIDVYQSYQRTAGLAPSMTSALAGLYVKWEMSGSEADGRAVRNLLNAFAASVGADGQFALRIKADLATGTGEPVAGEALQEHYFLTTFGGQHLLVELAELLGHADMSDAIVRYTRWFLAGIDPRDGARLCPVPSRRIEYRLRIATIAPFLAHACRHTGDAALAAALARVWREPLVDPERLDVHGDRKRPTVSVSLSHDDINKVACELGASLHLLPYALAGIRKPSSSDLNGGTAAQTGRVSPDLSLGRNA